MKKTLLILSMFAIPTTMMAQGFCGSARYDTEVFSAVTVTSNVLYGANVPFGQSTPQNLLMDVYEPTGDIETKRPLIVIAHGGSFVGGSKTDADQVSLCNAFAKRGFVVATINYRLYFYPINGPQGKAAVWRATQDMKAALRFFRKDAEIGGNTYRTDTSMYIAGGVSAGAFMAIHLAYLNKPSEIPTDIDTMALGGLEGNSGNPGYSSEVKAVINVCGAIGDSAWIEPGDIPMVTMQGNVDNTVPYCTSMLYVSGTPIMVVSGGGAMHTRMINLGINNPIHTFYGQGHTSPGATGNIDTTIALASDFLYKFLGCTPASSVDLTNQPTCTLTGIHELSSSQGLNVYPVPAAGAIKVDLTFDNLSNISAELFDLSGRRVETYAAPDQNGFFINRNGKEAGVYFLKVTSESGKTAMAKVIWTN